MLKPYIGGFGRFGGSQIFEWHDAAGCAHFCGGNHVFERGNGIVWLGERYSFGGGKGPLW